MTVKQIFSRVRVSRRGATLSRRACVRCREPRARGSDLSHASVSAASHIQPPAREAEAEEEAPRPCAQSPRERAKV